MPVAINKEAIDLGIVTKNLNAMLTFSGETLGLPLEATIDMPGGGVMHRYKVGDSVVKIVETEPRPEIDAAPGGIRGATGYRYWTIHVSNLDECLQQIAAAKHAIVVPKKVIREGVTIAIVEDPDGNWVELLETAA